MAWLPQKTTKSRRRYTHPWSSIDTVVFMRSYVTSSYTKCSSHPCNLFGSIYSSDLDSSVSRDPHLLDQFLKEGDETRQAKSQPPPRSHSSYSSSSVVITTRPDGVSWHVHTFHCGCGVQQLVLFMCLLIDIRRKKNSEGFRWKWGGMYVRSGDGTHWQLSVMWLCSFL